MRDSSGACSTAKPVLAGATLNARRLTHRAVARGNPACTISCVVTRIVPHPSSSTPWVTPWLAWLPLHLAFRCLQSNHPPPQSQCWANDNRECSTKPLIIIQQLTLSTRAVTAYTFPAWHTSQTKRHIQQLGCPFCRLPVWHSGRWRRDNGPHSPMLTQQTFGSSS